MLILEENSIFHKTVSILHCSFSLDQCKRQAGKRSTVHSHTTPLCGYHFCCDLERFSNCPKVPVQGNHKSKPSLFMGPPYTYIKDLIFTTKYCSGEEELRPPSICLIFYSLLPFLPSVFCTQSSFSQVSCLVNQVWVSEEKTWIVLFDDQWQSQFWTGHPRTWYDSLFKWMSWPNVVIFFITHPPTRSGNDKTYCFINVFNTTILAWDKGGCYLASLASFSWWAPVCSRRLPREKMDLGIFAAYIFFSVASSWAYWLPSPLPPLLPCSSVIATATPTHTPVSASWTR